MHIFSIYNFYFYPDYHICRRHISSSHGASKTVFLSSNQLHRGLLRVWQWFPSVNHLQPSSDLGLLLLRIQGTQGTK